MPFKVLIIGCGLAGALLGNGLLEAGVDFEIYETDEADASRDGYQIRLGAPAIRGFRSCLTEAQQAVLYKKFGRSGGVISSAPILYDTHLNQLLDLTKFPAYTKSAPINRVVLRDFLRGPLNAAGKVKYGKQLAKYKIVKTVDGQESVKAYFTDGSEVECDLLVSAEGSRSVVNTQIGLNNIVQLRSKWGFLAKGSLKPSRLEGLSPLVRKAPITIIKDGIILFYSAYLPDAQKGIDNGQRSESEFTYDADAASSFWGLSIPVEMCVKDPRDLEDPLEYCLEKIKDWDPRVHDMLRATDDKDIYVFQARASTQPAQNWRSRVKKSAEPELGHGQVWLLGDAIHPMLPARGMGGNQAMCDTADMLPQIVALNAKAKERTLGAQEYDAAVQIYEKAMIPRAFGWVKKSGGTGQRTIEPTGIPGKVMLFFVARVLDILYVYSLAKTYLGYKPVDDAAELPN